MTFEGLQTGLSGEFSLVVAEEHTAKHLGSGASRVLATPQMVLLMERAGVAAVDHLLPEGYRTVGGHLDVRHLAPTPVGFLVTARAELTEIHGRRLVFRVQATEAAPSASGGFQADGDLVGEGTHQRFIINVREFGERVAGKQAP